MSRPEMVTTMLGDNHNTAIFIMKFTNLQKLLLHSTQSLHFAKENNFCCCQMNYFAQERYHVYSDKPEAYGTLQCSFCKTMLNINQEEDAEMMNQSSKVSSLPHLGSNRVDQVVR